MWPHRWEHDKGPEELLALARRWSEPLDLREMPRFVSPPLAARAAIAPTIPDLGLLGLLSVTCFGVSRTSVVAELTSRKKTRIVNTSISDVRFMEVTAARLRDMRFMRREFFTVRLRSRCW